MGDVPRHRRRLTVGAVPLRGPGWPPNGDQYFLAWGLGLSLLAFAVASSADLTCAWSSLLTSVDVDSDPPQPLRAGGSPAQKASRNATRIAERICFMITAPLRWVELRRVLGRDRSSAQREPVTPPCGPGQRPRGSVSTGSRYAKAQLGGGGPLRIFCQTEPSEHRRTLNPCGASLSAFKSHIPRPTRKRHEFHQEWIWHGRPCAASPAHSREIGRFRTTSDRHRANESDPAVTP